MRRIPRWMTLIDGVGGASTPSSLSGLQLWLASDDSTTLFQDNAGVTPVTADGNSVGDWKDKSGKGKDATQATGAAKPTYKTSIFGSLPALSLDAGDSLNSTAIGSGDAITLFAVVKTGTLTGTAKGIITCLSNVNSLGAALVMFTNNGFAFNVEGVYLVAPTTASANTKYIVAGRIVGGVTTMWLNGENVIAGSRAAAASSNILRVGTFYMSSTSLAWDGHISEIAVYNRSLTDSEMYSILRYLNSKWSVHATPQTVFAVGDSKTAGDSWVPTLVADLVTQTGGNWSEKIPRFGVSGYTAAQMSPYIDANLASVSGKADIITINLGANDVSALPAQATWKADMTHIINALLDKWKAVQIYIARPWRRSYATECNSLATWISDIVLLYPNSCHLGPDERIWLENGDDGVTYTIDGIHYRDETTEGICATKWMTSLGY